MMPAPPLVDRFRRDLDALVPADARLGVAVSGGPDSLALLLLATAARPGNVEAATVDHGLRPESAAEAAMVASLCEELGLRHSTLPVHPQAPLASNLQAWARAQRYDKLTAWAAELGLTAIATAHHADDQAETILMRLARGAGVGGLAGVQRRRAVLKDHPVDLVRPLLGWRRSELEAIVDHARLNPVRDPSNADERFDRTRARDLLTATDWLEPPRLASSASHLADAEEALEWITEREFDARVTSDGSGLTVDPAGLPRELRRRLLAKGIAAFGCEDPPGPKLIAALDQLEAGGVTTLAGLKLEGGSTWRITSAPPRRGS